ncbi:hypothetical protein FE848_00755 [Marinobacter sp. 1-3A]|uniref:hypothetical protein n=1 Tax=Marinobacter sp. 1-3A TaxID=2582920 RepID=UPI00190751FF|nr:hypothetical protein [Marinobacter sp. 1-3A]MBK1871743.1 hypothetical protein [Marinobacter sp. 1-3A]
MQNSTVKDGELLQLKEALQSPITPLNDDNGSAALLEAKQLLITSGRCCIVVATSTGSNTLQNITNLYQGMASLKRLKKHFLKERPDTRATLIGIYPSLEYPACVFELNTNADRYVAGNVLPHTGSLLETAVKSMISRLLGVSPAVGGIGLAVYRE